MMARRHFPQKHRTPVGYSEVSYHQVHNKREEGFTLIELLVVVMILPLIVGGITLALLATFRIQSSVANRLSGSQDAQSISAQFVHDVQSASRVTTSASASVNPTCGSNTGTRLLGLQWTGSANTVISYSLVQNGVVTGTTTPTYALERQVCSQGSATVTNTQVLSQNVNSLIVPSNSINPSSNVTVSGCSATTTNCPPITDNAANEWLSTNGVQSVTLPVSESTITNLASMSTYSYVLQSAPRNSNYLSMGQSKPNSAVPPLLLLGRGASANINLNGKCSVTVSGQIALNSTNPVTKVGKSTITATTLYTAAAPGAISNVTVTGSPTLTNQSVIPDPYSNLVPPSTTGLPIYPTQPSTLTPGVYNSTLTLNGGNVTLPSGIYILNAGLSLGGNATVTGAGGGVFIYIPSGSGTITMSGSSSLSLSPLASPPAPYLTIWDATSNPITIGGSASISTGTGVIYAPGANISLNGSGQQGPFIGSGNLLANTLSCVGNGSINTYPAS